MAMTDGDVRGFVRGDMAGARTEFERNFTDGEEVGACFCATVDGETVADLWGGYADAARSRVWAPDTIVNVYSTTKTLSALTALLIADRGELDFAAPVARYWPEFAANGKADITVAQVMSHSAGCPAGANRCAPRTSTTGRRRPRPWPPRSRSGSRVPRRGTTLSPKGS
jgi:CubicO group peptidase (beta-lactamase class C family)